MVLTSGVASTSLHSSPALRETTWPKAHGKAMGLSRFSRGRPGSVTCTSARHSECSFRMPYLGNR
jgi:hypothetical protein